MSSVLERQLSRRRFLGASAAGGAALLLAGTGSSALAASPPTLADLSRRDEDEDWFEASIPRLQRLMRKREITSAGLTKAYLRRIRRLDPVLGSVIETNPDALRIAAQRDRERRRGHVRGPLHGIPILVKDNVATRDKMETTAGSFALEGSRVPRDAEIVRRLRRAGAVILGKANLSEWANFRGFIPPGFPNGWSGRGDFTRNPYVLSWDPCGSSSGSAVAAAANLASVTIGTETDGSILCPAGNNNVVGLKPTLGLVAQNGIIPIAHSQDTAGPITRTVTDAAILLNAIRSPFGPVKGHKLPRDYTKFLRRGALKGARIGVDRLNFQEDYFAVPELNLVTEQALDVMADAGATIIDIEPADCPDPNTWFDPEFAVLLNEFKHDIAAYLKPVRRTEMRDLADLIEFNIEHCAEEMTYFGQEIFDMAQAMSGESHRSGISGGSCRECPAGRPARGSTACSTSTISTCWSRRRIPSGTRRPPSRAMPASRSRPGSRRTVVRVASGCPGASSTSRSSSGSPMTSSRSSDDETSRSTSGPCPGRSRMPASARRCRPRRSGRGRSSARPWPCPGGGCRCREGPRRAAVACRAPLECRPAGCARRRLEHHVLRPTAKAH